MRHPRFQGWSGCCSNDLKATGTGIYQEVFDNIDYGDQTPEEAVETLLDGMESVGYTIG